MKVRGLKYLGMWQEYRILDVNSWGGVQIIEDVDYAIASNFVLVSTGNQKSPVVTKIVTAENKEVVPGVYDRVEVDGVYGKAVTLKFLTCSGKPSGIYSFTVEELESASKVFSDLAGYIKGKD